MPMAFACLLVTTCHTLPTKRHHFGYKIKTICYIYIFKQHQQQQQINSRLNSTVKQYTTFENSSSTTTSSHFKSHIQTCNTATINKTYGGHLRTTNITLLSRWGRAVSLSISHSLTTTPLLINFGAPVMVKYRYIDTHHQYDEIYMIFMFLIDSISSASPNLSSDPVDGTQS